MAEDTYLRSIFSFHKQLWQSYTESKQIKLPGEYSGVSNIVIAGMGGSIFGGLILKGAFSSELKKPLALISDYLLPAFADENTLFIVSSCSGNTEETLGALKEARGRRCKIVAISSGGKLGDYIKDNQIPGYIYDPEYNFDSKVPRTGIGYTAGSVLGIFSKLGLIEFSGTDIKALAEDISSYVEFLKHDLAKASSLSSKFIGKIPVFISSEHTNCAGHIFRNFFNETSKNLAFNLQIPDMNHHFLDGLKYPADASSNFVFVFLESNLYHPRNKKRFEITKSVIQRSGYAEAVIKTSGKNKMLDIWEIIILGCVVSYQLALSHKVDPATNEMVNYLKSELGSFQADFHKGRGSSIPTIL
ncbi:hypothetical protein A2982_02765 [candidate division WWE3 bacterium RIFCSPLOWO2_01_FULL_39_13]|uniref:SIS domain-containing protein n=1 Tax=candidate division WWE3 bacterium RIFCSPLOWO2_01_FULL_39_13 TaxID=1802624 RepID=A0A1F4V4K0_UNCKA|nr:MAG: hypothetical protein A2982_02765 [candidate division WWE3 bacterium RIFCSPLOWO2_01_FULL_39_13]